MLFREKRGLNHGSSSAAPFRKVFVPVLAGNPERRSSTATPCRAAERVSIFHRWLGLLLAWFPPHQLVERNPILAHLLHDFPQRVPRLSFFGFRQLSIQSFLLRPQLGDFNTLICHDFLKMRLFSATDRIGA